MEKEKQGLVYERNPIVRELDSLQGQAQELESAKRTAEQALSQVQERIRMRKADMKALEKELLTNPTEESVSEEVEKWTGRKGQIDGELERILTEEKRLVGEQKEKAAEIEALRQQVADLEGEKKQLAYHLEEVSQREVALIEKLASVRQQWASLDSVYFQQETIATRILDSMDQIDKERSNLLYKERLSYRFVDDYEGQSTFFSDAYVESQLPAWRNKFGFLQTGVEYLETFEEVERERKILDYPLWPVTLVTTAKAKVALEVKLKEVADRLQFPIVVMTTEEAAGISTGGDNSSGERLSWIAPAHWEGNSQSAEFAVWKLEIGEAARRITAQREAKEKERKDWEQALHEFDSFFAHYPFEKKDAWEKELREKTGKLEELARKIERLKDELEGLTRKLSSLKQTYEQLRDEKQRLVERLKGAEQYLLFAKQVEMEEKQEQEKHQQVSVLSREQKGLEQQLAHNRSQKDDLDSRIQRLDVQIQQLKEDDDFVAVKDVDPIFSHETKKVIKDRMGMLELKIREISVSLGELEAKRDGALERIETSEKQMQQLLNEHESIDVDRLFPSDGKQVMASIWKKIRSLKDETGALREEVQAKASLKDSQSGKVNTKLERFSDDFSGEEVEGFADRDLEEVAEELKEEKLRLKEKKEYLEGEAERVAKELGSISEAEQGLDRYAVGHHFNAPQITTEELGVDEVREFKLNRMGFVSAVTSELERNRDAVDGEKVHVERGKRAFRDFCNRVITDVKMRNMALNGVDHKESFADIIAFRKNMMVSVERATSYANEHIRQKDAELQTFINHIHTHLETIVEELRQIPKKTKVKVGEDWKQIFSFSIPEWESADGKLRIRDYMEWILQQLESERFLNEEGVQDGSKVRKELEAWLHSKQLLQMIMNNEAMKVSCRKVTNDNKVTTRSYSWEQSNVWSGGEKWSKNMTLFLGILNYVAEKKQHIQPKMKRHRAVILDNPFGKASSDHVLSPVFFIAEQLGFQIIALTAHAEGKFLQDFFPIIYSCRLRGASGNAGKQVMTKEKWLHHAYFQDHEPKTIDRLGETEQIALF
ncbi:MAG: hypothetical protein LRY73_05540 [Bacillus sp. (in: Bacteria)]|nr:hypothetical protein [Bacillus sp. (in: firmicutes)]